MKSFVFFVGCTFGSNLETHSQSVYFNTAPMPPIVLHACLAQICVKKQKHGSRTNIPTLFLYAPAKSFTLETS